jgi:DNA-binding CsgD family transcriptional regulator
MKKINSKKRNAYGTVKSAVANCLEKNMTAIEIANLLGTSRWTVYSIAGRLNMKPKYVYSLKKKFPYGGLTKAITECCHKNMTTKEISEKLEYDFATVCGIAKKVRLKMKNSGIILETASK